MHSTDAGGGGEGEATGDGEGEATGDGDGESPGEDEDKTYAVLPSSGVTFSKWIEAWKAKAQSQHHASLGQDHHHETFLPQKAKDR